MKLTIVVPCYNEQEVLPYTADRLVGLLHHLRQKDLIDEGSRIYFVDDGSRDATWSLIAEYVGQGKPFVGVRLSRNRGHQNALLAGLFAAEGDAVISMDADLQDDPGAVEQMIEQFRDGADIVYGVRHARQTDSFFKRATAEGFYWLMARMGATTLRNHADYRLMSRRAVEALKQYREVNLFLRGVIPTLGFRTAVVEYARNERVAGESKYPLKRMIGLAIDGITSFSSVPLRLISIIGLLVSLASLVITAWALLIAVFSNRAVPGWASTVVPMYFLGGVQLLAMGVIGEYIGKIYLEVKDRPRFFIDEILSEPGSPAVVTRSTAAGVKVESGGE